MGAEEEEVAEERLTLILMVLWDGAEFAVGEVGVGLLLKEPWVLLEGTVSVEGDWSRSLFMGGIKSLSSESKGNFLQDSMSTTSVMGPLCYAQR